METATGEYNSIISLGANCAPAEAIRANFGAKLSFPFDWWIASPSSLLKVMQGRFERMFELDEMELCEIGSWSVRSRRYGIAYHHDFSRETQEVRHDFDTVIAELPAVREKYRRRFARLRQHVEGGRTLFLRLGLEEDGVSEGESVAGVFALNEALRALYPDADFDLLALPTGNTIDAKDAGNVAFDILGAETGNMWRREQFTALFQRRNLSLKPLSP